MPVTENTAKEKIDFTPSIAEEDEVPPPTYGDVYGEIRNEVNGLDTSACVTDDGRVNIRINQLNRRLSQIFVPALRQQVNKIQDDRPPPPAYIPPSLGGTGQVPPPPPMNIVIQIVGSRGDVQPFVALGKVLKNTYGHRIRIATHPVFKSFVQQNGLEFFSIGGDPAQLMAFMVKNPSLMPGMRSIFKGDVAQRRKDVGEYIQGCWRSCYEAGDGLCNDDASPETDNDQILERIVKPFVADCIIANPPSFAHIHCAEKLGVPLHIMFTMPYSPTEAFPHPLANIQSSNTDPQLTNHISYAMIEVLSWQGLGDIINRFRIKCLGLDPVSLIWAPGMLQRLRIPHTYCWSPALIPKPNDWASHVSVSGFCFLDSASDYIPSPELQAFLNVGPLPVYIGFGSIVLDNPDAMTELIIEAARKTGQRILLSKGWGGLHADELHVPTSVFFIDNVPHDWLFTRVSCVVHHGGAGTTAAGIAAGRPTVIVPFFGDQPFWGAMIARAGAGPDPIPHKQLTAEKLAHAIDFCLTTESLERAHVLASKIAAERGNDASAQSFHQQLDFDRLRCTLAPSRLAVWRVKRTQIRLSTFAACTLANASLLDFRELKLFRSQEYCTDEGPWDPISGFGAQLIGTLSSMTLGLTDFPTETAKAFLLPMTLSRRQSGTSTTSATRIQDSVTQTQSSADSGTPILTSDIRASSASNVLHVQSSPDQSNDSSNKVQSKKKSNSVKDRDMLRQTGVHTSKGFGRIVRAGVKAPMDLSMSITKGFHNVPKLWGDDTVRPQESVTDLKSGMVAIGKEFGFGFYDGLTGLVTQPWKGAQKEGATGFLKGFGKGVGGLVAKPGAALFGIPTYLMKGVHKEAQKLYTSNVQNSIVATRTAQGYEEWLQSSEAEKEDIIIQWKLIQKYLKKKSKPDEMMMRDLLKAQQKMNTENRQPRLEATHTITTADSACSVDVDNSTISSQDIIVLAIDDSEGSGNSPESTDTTEFGRLSARNPPCSDSEDNAHPAQEAQEEELQHMRLQEEADHRTEEESIRQAIAASEAEAQRHADEVLEYEAQLTKVIARSLAEQR